MSGARYEDWHHTRYEGDVDAGKALLPLARKVLGYAAAQASYRGLQTYKHVHTLPDGGAITAEIRGDIPRVTISTPGGGAEAKMDTLSGIVVWARDEFQPGGIDPETPQQILRPKWRTFFYSEGTAGYDEFERAKGVYAPDFPGGINAAGNVDWISPRGEVISWHGPSARLFADPFVQFRQQYGQHVYMNGREVLNVRQYNLDSDDASPTTDALFVLGACLGRSETGRVLYVIHAAVTADRKDEEPTIGAGEIEVSTPYATGAGTVYLCSYAVAPTADGVLAVQAGSRQILAGVAIKDGWNQPWRFSRDGVEGTCTAAPDVTFLSLANLPRSGATAPAPATLVSAPPSTNRIYRVVTGPVPGFSFEVVSTPPGGNAALFRDYGPDGPIEVRVARAPAPWAIALEFDGQQLPMMDETLQAGDQGWEAPRTYRRLSRWMLWGSPRDRTFVFLRADYSRTFVYNVVDQIVQYNSSQDAGGAMVVEVWRDGVLVAELPTESYLPFPTVLPQLNNLYGRGFSPMASMPLAPMAAVYGVHATFWNGISGRFSPEFGWYGMAYGRLVWPSPHIFGGFGYRYNAPSSGTQVWNPLRGGTLAGFASDKADTYGKVSVIGCVTVRGKERAYTALSCPSFSGRFVGGAPADITGNSIHFVDTDDLGSLTGVTGARRRYHPIWIMGAPAGAG